MKTLKLTSENIAKVEALKTIKETKWVGSLTFDSMDKCLASMNMNTINSGWYKPCALRIKGLQGIFMTNEDGGLYFEQRIIKMNDKKFRVESLCDSGYNDFENKYLELLSA
jgi:hypothetical protein